MTDTDKAALVVITEDDFEGDTKAFAEISRAIAMGGMLPHETEPGFVPPPMEYPAKFELMLRRRVIEAARDRAIADGVDLSTTIVRLLARQLIDQKWLTPELMPDLPNDDPARTSLDDLVIDLPPHVFAAASAVSEFENNSLSHCIQDMLIAELGLDTGIAIEPSKPPARPALSVVARSSDIFAAADAKAADQDLNPIAYLIDTIRTDLGASGDLEERFTAMIRKPEDGHLLRRRAEEGDDSFAFRVLVLEKDIRVEQYLSERYGSEEFDSVAYAALRAAGDKAIRLGIPLHAYIARTLIGDLRQSYYLPPDTPDEAEQSDRTFGDLNDDHVYWSARVYNLLVGPERAIETDPPMEAISGTHLRMEGETDEEFARRIR